MVPSQIWRSNTFFLKLLLFSFSFWNLATVIEDSGFFSPNGLTCQVWSLTFFFKAQMWWESLTNEDLRTPSYPKIGNISCTYITEYIIYTYYIKYHILYIFLPNCFILKYQKPLSKDHPSTTSGASHVWCCSPGSLGRGPGGGRWENFKDAIATWRRSRALEMFFRDCKKMKGNGQRWVKREYTVYIYGTLLLADHTWNIWLNAHAYIINGCDDLNHSWMVDMSQKDLPDLYHVNVVWVKGHAWEVKVAGPNPNDSWWNDAWHRMNPVHTTETVDFDTDFTQQKVLLLWLALLHASSLVKR